MLERSDLAVLTDTFLFRGRSPEELCALLESVPYEVRAFDKGEVIYSPESYRRELGAILSGRILVTKGELVVSELRPAELFGAAALFNEEERYVSTLTARSRGKALFLSQSAVSSLIDRDAAARENYIRYLAQRIRFLSGKVDTLSSGSGERKLASYLLSSAGEDGRLTVPSMTQLASRLSMGRASLYREIQDMEKRGIIARSGKTITVINSQFLREL